MNQKEEGEYYYNMVRKFRTGEYGTDLQSFCKEEKLSYTKMFHNMRSQSYYKPKQKSITKKPALESAPMEQDSVEDSQLRPLVVDNSLSQENSACPSSNLELDGVDITVASRYRIRVSHCDIPTLMNLIKEMEEVLCKACPDRSTITFAVNL